MSYLGLGLNLGLELAEMLETLQTNRVKCAKKLFLYFLV